MNGGDEASRLLDEAARLDRQAHSEEALQVLGGCVEWPLPYNERGLLLRAKILLVQDPIAALDELPEDAEAFDTYEARLGSLVIRARAYMATRNPRSALGAIRQAEALLRDDDDENRRLVASVRAYMSWQQREYDPGNKDIAAAMHADDPTVRFNMLNLRGWMHCGLEDYRAQLRDLMECMRMYERNPSAYHLLSVARTVQSILGLTWEMGDMQAGEDARGVFESIPWTPELGMYRFLCLRGLGWHTFFAGDSTQAYSLFDLAKETAPSQAWRVMAHSDHAYVARLKGDEHVALYELGWAQRLAAAVNWPSTRLEERSGLLNAAVLLVPADVPAAQQLLSAYTGLHAHALNERIEFSHETRRLYAFRDYADGIVQAALGKRSLAGRLLWDAYRTFSQYDFALRAMLAAQALFETTGEERWLQAALLHARAYPNAGLQIE